MLLQQPKRRTAAPTSEGGRLELSPPAALDAVLAQLQSNRRTLEVWTGRLREWLAHDLLQPLAAIIKDGHKVGRTTRPSSTSTRSLLRLWVVLENLKVCGHLCFRPAEQIAHAVVKVGKPSLWPLSR